MQSRRPVVGAATAVLTIAMSLVAPPQAALAAPVLDQQQPTIGGGGGIVIGGSSLQMVAQTVTAGIGGDVVKVELPAACAGSADLIIEIRDVTSDGEPGGTVKATTTITGSTIPAFFPAPTTFRTFTFATPATILAGAQYAIVLSSTGTTVGNNCAIFPGPFGQSYSGGEYYYDSLPNQPGWIHNCGELPNDRCDLPFKTWVEPAVLPGRIVFKDGTGLGVVDPDGGGLVSLACASDCQSPTWSPNGAKISFATARDGNREIYVMNADGSAQTRLTTNAGLDGDPAWSPDGAKIAYTRQDPTTFQLQVYVMNANGTGQANVSSNGHDDQEPAWSPDGAKIAFVSFRDGNGEIYAMNVNGTSQTRLTNDPAADIEPEWSPNAAKIAFSSSRDLGWPLFDVYVMNANGTGQTRLTTDAATDESPTWSPDGTRIGFWSARGGGQRLYHMNPNGTDQTVIPTVLSPGVQPDWGSFSTGETASGTVAAGGTVGTDTEGDGATTADAIETTVTSPNAGAITIKESTATGAAPSGYAFLGVQVSITAPAATAVSPLVIVFLIDASLIPSGGNENTIQVFRNGALVPACTGTGGTASPDPCVSSRQLLPSGDVRITILTSSASRWDFAVLVNRAPDCSTVRPSEPLLWPADHRLRTVILDGATDPDGDNVSVDILGVTQDEPLDGTGDGDTSPDAVAGSSSDAVLLRAERSASGDGRVYRIVFRVSDGNGGVCDGLTTVGVPRDMGKGRTPIDTTSVTVGSFGP